MPAWYSTQWICHYGYGRYGYVRYGKYGYGNYGSYGNYASSHYGDKNDGSIKK